MQLFSAGADLNCGPNKKSPRIISPNVIVVQGAGKETLRLFGDAHAVNRVRAAMFNAALNWSPLDLD